MLRSRMMEYLRWDGPLTQQGMVRLRTIGDGSCFFHAICYAVSKEYRTGYYNDGTVLDRREYVSRLRRELSDNLSSVVEVDSASGNGVTRYSLLSRGQLESMSAELPEYSLPNMKALLVSRSSVDNRFNEHVSNCLNIDIYILSHENEDVYITGNDTDILYKDRDSVVILYVEDSQHYELVGVNTGHMIRTVFPYNDEFILKIRSRIREVISSRTG